MKSIVSLQVALALSLLVVFSAPAPAAGSGPASLEMDASFLGPYRTADSCVQTPPPGTSECSLVEATAGVSGLGPTALRFTFVNVGPRGVTDQCRLYSTSDATFTVSGKGQIDFTSGIPSCQPPPDPRSGVINTTLPFTVTGGSGIYAGATGAGTLKVVWRGGAKTSAEWLGTLSVPGLEFDTTPPTVSGATSRLVSVGHSARGARVRYAVAASDAEDGTVAVTCDPRSGSFFRLGTTRVACTATDSSSNSTSKSFTVVVKRR